MVYADSRPSLLRRWGGIAISAAAALLAASCIPHYVRRPPLAVGPTRVIGTLVVIAPAEGESRGATEIELADATVYLVDAAGRRSASAVTQLDGRFGILEASSGQYRLCYEIGTLRGCGRQVSVAGGEIAIGRIPIAAGSFIRGRVLTGDGRPCWVSDSFFGLDVTTRVAAAPAGSGGPPQATGRANVQGDYALFGLRPGRYDVTARCEEATVTAAANLRGSVATRDLTLPNRAPEVRTAAAFAGARGVVQASPGASVDLRATAVDPDGDRIQYIWRTLESGSSALSGSGAAASWQLPREAGLRSAYLMARDGRGGFTYRRIDIMAAPGNRVVVSGRAVDERSGAPVSGASVTFGSASGRTDANGGFMLESEQREDSRYMLNIRHRDYALVSRALDRGARGDSYEMTPVQVTQVVGNAPIRLLDRASGSVCANDPAVGYARTAVSGAARRLRASDRELASGQFRVNRILELARATESRCLARGAEIALPAGALVGADERSVSGPIRATVTTLNPARRTLPGDYSFIRRGGETGALLSFGAVEARFTDAAGRPLDLRSGTTAEVRIPVAPNQLANAPATMAMWSYDEVNGRWVAEGEARLVRGPEGAFYVGQTRHFSTINMDIDLNPLSATCVRFKVSGFGSWTNLRLRAYATYNGTSSQVAETPLDADEYHAIRALPFGPGNTLRLEISGTDTALGVVRVLLDDIIPLGPPRLRMTATEVFPPHPYDGCDDVGTLSPSTDVIPFYGINDATGRPYFLTGPGGAFNPNPSFGAAYYTAIAGSAKSTLEQWWTANGFTTAGLGGTRAAYMNHNDLGFGRDMHCIEPGGGKLACYVTNYGLADQNPQNAQDALDQNVATRAATVAMEYDPAAAGTFEEVQFYVYNGGVGTSTRLEFADLDGFGPKPVPHLCMVCHGGEYSTGTNRVRYARFREFDLPSFVYPLGPTGVRWNFGGAVPASLDATAFARLNQMVRNAHPTFPVGQLIDAWYATSGFGAGAMPDVPAPPSGWSLNAADSVIYHDVYGQSCRTCHIARDHNNSLLSFENIVFDTAVRFRTTGFYVCGGSGANRVRRMPNAVVTYRNFWADTTRTAQYRTFITPAQPGCGS